LMLFCLTLPLDNKNCHRIFTAYELS
jgi:hypothetical protein